MGINMPTFLAGLVARLFTWNRTVLSFWARRARVVTFTDVPWVPLERPARECTVALVTTAGVHRSSDKPFDMSDRTGDPSFREIPSDVSGSGLPELRERTSVEVARRLAGAGVDLVLLSGG